MSINEAARQMGKKGGLSRSLRKQQASRNNFARARELKAIKNKKQPAIPVNQEGSI